MSISSMTGFARTDGASGVIRWAWELRSVNGRGLDIRLRLPPGYDRLDLGVRERCGATLSRGNLQVSLAVDAATGGIGLRINEAVLAEVIAAMRRIATEIAVSPPSADGVLAVRGVLEAAETEPDEGAQEAFDVAVMAGLDAALAGLVAMRQREGATLAEVLSARLDEIARLTRAAEAHPARTQEAIRARLAEQVAALLGASPQLDPDRLHQEAALLATRADIREELDRLDAHVTAVRALIAGGGPIGRRLDFLAQEFNREVNTLCAKANDRGLTAIGLDLKAVVDQLREQIQNIE